MREQEMTQDDKSAPDLELVKLIYHTAHKTAEDRLCAFLGGPLSMAPAAKVEIARDNTVLSRVMSPVTGVFTMCTTCLHQRPEDKGIPIPTVVSALVHAASVMARIYDCPEIFESAVKVNRLEASRLEEIRGGYQVGMRWTPVLRQVAMRGSCSYKRLRNRSSQ
jgi:hypothetical protein